ncbi:MAG: c-type cytochrome, partial [Planctomycetales bacterium]|nr:c-type cytochrome [Planctomycetales bacterium]
VGALAAKPGSVLEQQIAAASGGQAAELMRELLTKARADAVDKTRPLEQRVAAVQLLRLGKLDGQEETFAALLAPSEPADIQAAALDSLASFDAPEVADTISGVWRTLSPRLRTRAGDVLFSRESWLRFLLEAVQSQQIAVADLDPARLKVLAAHRDPAVREQAAQLVSQSNPRGRQEIVVAYQGVLGQSGDVDRGRQVFQKTCAACHRLEGKGHEIGPNLAAMKARGDEAILVNVLDPNREVNPQYLSYVLVTGDGRSLTGLIAAETATSVTLRRADNASDTVLRVDIDELLSTGLSLMPEGLEKQIDQQAMKDLLAYLRAVE